MTAEILTTDPEYDWRLHEPQREWQERRWRRIEKELRELTFHYRQDGQWLVLGPDGYEAGLTYDNLDQALRFAWNWIAGD